MNFKSSNYDDRLTKLLPVYRAEIGRNCSENRLRNHRSFCSRGTHSSGFKSLTLSHYTRQCRLRLQQFSLCSPSPTAKQHSRVTIRSLLNKHFVLYQLLLFFREFLLCLLTTNKPTFLSLQANKSRSRSENSQMFSCLPKAIFPKKANFWMPCLRCDLIVACRNCFGKYYRYSQPSCRTKVMDGRKTIVTSRSAIFLVLAASKSQINCSKRHCLKPCDGH